MSSMNRYSYAWVCTLIAIAGFALTFIRNDLRWGMGTLIFSAVVLVYFVSARRGSLTPANPLKRIRRAQAAGRPLVVCFYSDYHMGSLFQRPFSAAAEKAYRSKCEFMYIDVNHREGSGAAEELEASPGTFRLFDQAGKPAGETGILTIRAMEQLMEHPSRGD